MSEHSPGPWRWPEHRPPCVKDAAGELVLGCNVFAQPSAADARLIAAAPEMLELLRKMSSHLTKMPQPPDHVSDDIADETMRLCDLADAVLARIDGKETT